MLRNEVFRSTLQDFRIEVCALCVFQCAKDVGGLGKGTDNSLPIARQRPVKDLYGGLSLLIFQLVRDLINQFFHGRGEQAALCPTHLYLSRVAAAFSVQKFGNG